jgi:hypothetical protein
MFKVERVQARHLRSSRCRGRLWQDSIILTFSSRLRPSSSSRLHGFVLYPFELLARLPNSFGLVHSHIQKSLRKWKAAYFQYAESIPPSWLLSHPTPLHSPPKPLCSKCTSSLDLNFNRKRHEPLRLHHPNLPLNAAHTNTPHARSRPLIRYISEGLRVHYRYSHGRSASGRDLVDFVRCYGRYLQRVVGDGGGRGGDLCLAGF